MVSIYVLFSIIMKLAKMSSPNKATVHKYIFTNLAL